MKIFQKLIGYLKKYNIHRFARNFRMNLMRFYYRTPDVSHNSYLGFGCVISRDFKLGAHSYIGPRTYICPGVVAGKYVMLGAEVMIVGKDHRIDRAGTPTIFSGRPTFMNTNIEDDVWIGARVLLLAGVKIGRGAVIGAGSVVSKDIPPYAVAVGVPANVIRFRFDEGGRSIHDEMLRQSDFVGEYCKSIGS
jgi:acetyltransferase-like isoleucine patch superfamily enzyme